MRTLIVLSLLTLIALSVRAADRELTYSREMLDDAIIRNDADGMQLVRERLLRLVAAADDKSVLRDAHYLVALSALYEIYSGERDLGASASIIALGNRHAEKAVELDPNFADGWMMSAILRGAAQRAVQKTAPDPEALSRFKKAVELDPKSPGVALFNGVLRATNPNGPANPEGVKIFDDLADRLDADRAATGRRFGMWDAEAHAWKTLVRIAAAEPSAETLRPLAAYLTEQRPDFDLGQFIARSVAERKFVAAPAVTWQPFLTDAANDGKDPKLPDVIAVDRAESGDVLWYRVAFREPLPRSFGVNIVVNRSGSPTTGAAWWSPGSTARFDRLVTVWISRDVDHGVDRYFGRVGVSDNDGVRGAHLDKIPADILVAMGSDDRSVMIGVPRAALGLTDASTIVVAGGSHLVWNDDAASPAKSR